ncbi:hypothetical protein RRG08_008546 [Elysia crispata]|uniref:Uncharacterized protein n=1 Tax=Elysia crispata TaxID=231223 RepID=A0AAE0YE24_9GAST|nr:hypothetical protein RRG08_008546 [Elysia crispata]
MPSQPAVFYVELHKERRVSRDVLSLRLLKTNAENARAIIDSVWASLKGKKHLAMCTPPPRLGESYFSLASNSHC